MVPHDNSNKKTQHRGFGKRLLKEAEKIAYSKGFKKMAIISGIGVREYYENRGYNLEETFMVKKLKYDFEEKKLIISIIISLISICFYLLISTNYLKNYF